MQEEEEPDKETETDGQRGGSTTRKEENQALRKRRVP